MIAGTTGSPPASSASDGARDELNVLAVIDHLAQGGAEMLLGQFASAAPKAGIRLHVSCLEIRDGNPAAEPLRKVGVEPVNLEVPGRPGTRHVMALRHHIAATRPDLVHTHLGTSDFVGGLAARSLGVPVVSTIHEVRQKRAGLRRAKGTIFDLTQRVCDDRVIVVSESARRAYLRQTWGMDKRVVQIYNGIDLDPAPGSGAAVRRELGIGPDELVVGMVSALRPEKGHDIAIEAVGRLRAQFGQLRLLIAGQGELAGELERLAAPLGDAVVLAGRRTDVAAVFDALDVCLQPSRIDAFPTTLIEALAASVPVIASSVGGIPEIIEDGVTGVLLAPPPSAESLARELGSLLPDVPRRERLASAGHSSYHERFTAGPWLERTRALYDQILSEHRGSRRARQAG